MITLITACMLTSVTVAHCYGHRRVKNKVLDIHLECESTEHLIVNFLGKKIGSLGKKRQISQILKIISSSSAAALLFLIMKK